MKLCNQHAPVQRDAVERATSRGARNPMLKQRFLVNRFVKDGAMNWGGYQPTDGLYVDDRMMIA